MSHFTRRAFMYSSFLTLGATQAQAYDWDYRDVRFDLTSKAILGGQEAFTEWRKEPLSYLTDAFNQAVAPDPVIIRMGSPIARQGYSLTEIELSFPGLRKDGTDQPYIATLAKPDTPRTGSFPTLVAINGHGEVGGEGNGQAPKTLFVDGAHGDQLAKAGSIIIALPNTIHSPLEHLVKNFDFSVIWARMADKALDSISREVVFEREFVGIGNAAGGLTSLVLTIMRKDFRALVVNGSFFSLEHTRREYRIFTHSFCHDFRAFFSYTPIYALVAPKPLMLQVGEKDGLWLGAGPATPQSWFSGTKRGAISDETIGAFLSLQRVWSSLGGKIELDIHPNGHEDLNAQAAKRFLLQLAEK